LRFPDDPGEILCQFFWPDIAVDAVRVLELPSGVRLMAGAVTDVATDNLP
jgi:hypothetical protein